MAEKPDDAAAAMVIPRDPDEGPTDDAAPTPKEIPGPDDFEDADAFLRHIRDQITDDLSKDNHNRVARLSDDEFFVGKQWDDDVLSFRQDVQKLPCMTENYLPSLVGQVTGSRRLNETVLKVAPDNGGTKDVARIREGLTCSIQKTSRSKLAYDKAFDCSAVGGEGAFYIWLQEAEDDVFAQDICIETVHNPLSIVWDKQSVELTGKDAEHVTVLDTMSSAKFKLRYPGHTPANATLDTGLLGELQASGWVENDNVRVAYYCRMRSRLRTVALMKDGSQEDITGRDVEEVDSVTGVMLAQRIASRLDGTFVMRNNVRRRYCEIYVVSGNAILEGPWHWPISRVPVLRVKGWEYNVGETAHRWGIVRHAKDSQRGHNYWRSVVNEKLMYTPKAPWIAPLNAVKGNIEEWRNAHRTNNGVLTWDDTETQNKPERSPPAQIEPALIAEGQTALQAMRDITNIHEAALGQQSNEVSGKAIMARQRVGELGTVIYTDNLNMAIEEAGRIINDLIPFVYDAPRVVLITGADNKDALQRINDPNDPESVDITIGKYRVTMTTGPSYTTKRVESAESMQSVFNAAPEVMGPAIDLFVEAQDWPGADKIVKRLRKTPAISPLLDPEDLTPEMEQAAQAAAQEAQKQAALAQALQEAQVALEKAKAAQAQADALLKAAQADDVPHQTALKAQEIAVKAAVEKEKAKKTRFDAHMQAHEFAHAGDESDGQK